MHALLHAIGAVLVLPYVGLASLFLLIGEAARSRGLFELIDALVFHADWFVRWGLYAFALLWVALLTLGCVPRLHRLGALCLALLAIGSLVVILALHSTPVGLGEVTFLVPCIVVAGASGGYLARAR